MVIYMLSTFFVAKKLMSNRKVDIFHTNPTPAPTPSRLDRCCSNVWAKSGAPVPKPSAPLFLGRSHWSLGRPQGLRNLLMHLCLTDAWADGVDQQGGPLFRSRLPFPSDTNSDGVRNLSRGLRIGSALCVATKDEILRAMYVAEATIAPNQTHTQNDRNSCE